MGNVNKYKKGDKVYLTDPMRGIISAVIDKVERHKLHGHIYRLSVAREPELDGRWAIARDLASRNPTYVQEMMAKHGVPFDPKRVKSVGGFRFRDRVVMDSDAESWQSGVPRGATGMVWAISGFKGMSVSPDPAGRMIFVRWDQYGERSVWKGTLKKIGRTGRGSRANPILEMLGMGVVTGVGLGVGFSAVSWGKKKFFNQSNPLTYAEALGMQREFAESMKGLYLYIRKRGQDKSTRVDLPRGRFYFETEFILDHYTLEVYPLKASSHVGAIGYYGDWSKRLGGIKFRTIEEANRKIPALAKRIKRLAGKYTNRSELNLISGMVMAVDRGVKNKGFAVGFAAPNL